MGEKNGKKKGGGKKEEKVTVVLKTDLHCDGCASKVIKCIRSIDDVEMVAIGEGEKITVVGWELDPKKLREKVEEKTHKKVELITPPKKDGDKKSKKKPEEDKKPEKEAPVTTAVMRLNLHCDGCVKKIRKTVTKTKGYKDMKIDGEMHLLTVTGAIDMKALAELLQSQLRRDVVIVSQMKEGDKKGRGGGGEERSEGNMMTMTPMGYPQPVGWMIGDPYIRYQNPYAYAVPPQPPPQMFSEENPNGCSVM